MVNVNVVRRKDDSTDRGRCPNAVYLLGLVMPDPSLSGLLARALPGLPVNEEKKSDAELRCR